MGGSAFGEEGTDCYGVNIAKLDKICNVNNIEIISMRYTVSIGEVYP